MKKGRDEQTETGRKHTHTHKHRMWKVGGYCSKLHEYLWLYCAKRGCNDNEFRLFPVGKFLKLRSRQMSMSIINNYISYAMHNTTVTVSVICSLNAIIV